MSLIDCSITIQRGNRVRYEEIVQGNRDGTSGGLVPDPLRLRTIARLEQWVQMSFDPQYRGQRQDGYGPDLKLIGAHLYNILFADQEIRRRFEERLHGVLED